MLYGSNFTTIDAPGSLWAPSVWTAVYGINNNDEDTVGAEMHYDLLSGWGIYGFIRRIDGKFDTFRVEDYETRGRGINDYGKAIVGYYYTHNRYRGFLRYHPVGNFPYFPFNFPGATDTWAYGINNNEDIVGSYKDSNGKSHGFLHTGGDLNFTTGFSTIDYPGAPTSGAHGINNNGEIVGWFISKVGINETHSGFLRTSGGSFYRIDVPGAQYTYPHGINDNGRVAGRYFDSRGQHGFAATPCNCYITPGGEYFDPPGGTGSLYVMEDIYNKGCYWEAWSDESWITITSGNSGSDNGTVNYTVAPNATIYDRTGTIKIGRAKYYTEQTYTISQGGLPCTYDVRPASASFASAGGTGGIEVTTLRGCDWIAGSNDSWITIPSVNCQSCHKSGIGTINYSVDANTNPSSRTGTMTIAGQTFTITQAGGSSCRFSISPTSKSFGSSDGTGRVTVTAPSGCYWSASSSASWITITSGSTGNGNGTVNYSVARNTSGIQRTGTMTIAGKTFTVTQALFHIPPCRYKIKPRKASFDSSGGTGGINVTTRSHCSWSASSNVLWITITGGDSGNGSGTVNYSVEPNASGSTRTGTITIGGKTFTVEQSG